MQLRAGRWGAWATAVAAALAPAFHPLLRPLLGVPSHLVWFTLSLPVAIATYVWGLRAAVPTVVASVAWVGVGEHLFGGGYGRSADEATQLALMAAVGFTTSLLAGFSLAARAEREHTRAVEAQLGQAQKMEAIGRLAGGVAHDFNNLLTVILSTGHMLRDDARAGTQAREDVDTIIGAASSASDLTRQLLAFSRRKEYAKRVLDISAVVRGMEGMLRRLVGEDVSVVFDLDAGAGHVEADAGQLEQVVLNLVVNARDAMPEGGTITISTGVWEVAAHKAARGTGNALTPGVYAVLEVNDTGAGMDAATQARIFEPFFTTKPPGKGTGLGLATVFGIVRDAGGGVLVSSRPGKGACIRACFRQVAPQGADSAALPIVVANEASGARRTILVVEDQPLVREATRRMLRGLGFDVTAVEDGRAAIEIMLTRPAFDLIVTDLIMPGMGGLGLAEHVAAHSPTTRVLFVSGYAGDGAGLHAALRSGHRFLQKPYDVRALAAAVGDTLGDGAAAGTSTYARG